MKIKSVIIVGGGSSGWMTAAAINYLIPEIKLTLIESDKITPIGVGESTLGHINRYFSFLNLKDDDWMKHCDATFKNSIQFTNFHKLNGRYQYPFGFLDSPNNKITHNKFEPRNYTEFLLIQKMYPKEIELEDFIRYYNFTTILAEKNKQTDMIFDTFNPVYHTAYHMNADKFGLRLKELYCEKIEHVMGTVDEVLINEKGVESLRVNDKFFNADLYIDCTGFKSLLLEQSLNEKFIRFKNLPNDSAIVGRREYVDENDKKISTVNVTDCKGLSSGWLFNTPLWNRVGYGYVYSSSFIDDSDAEEEFLKETKCDNSRIIKMKHGYHYKSWVKNVVSIGLSWGFIEPLEATGLFTTHENIISFVEILMSRECHVNSIDREMFNHSVRSNTLDMADFVALHYGASRRDDTEYWNHVTQKNNYHNYDDGVFHRHSLSEEMFSMLNDLDFNYDWDGFLYVLLGSEYNPVSIKQAKYKGHDFSGFEQKKDYIIKKLKEKYEIASTLDTNYEFMKKTIYRGEND